MTPTFQENLQRLLAIATEYSLKLNPDEARVQKVVGLMAANYDAAGEWICPCKQQHKPAKEGMDKTCPCPEWLDEIAKDGHCFCRLFFAKA